MSHRKTTRESGQGVLIVGHGTRDRAGVDQFNELVAAVAARLPETVVEGGFLELAQPSIAGAMSRAVERGASRRLDVVPLVLCAAGHAKSDIPRVVAAAAVNYPSLATRLLPHLGLSDAVVDLSARRCLEALASLPEVPASETLLVIVGRGSRDAQANDEMAEFARRRFQRLPAARLEVCFLAMAQPPLGATLRKAGSLPFRRIVVQPHFLFPGELLDRIGAEVAEAKARFPRPQWVVTRPLGPDRLLCEAIVGFIS